MKITALNTRLIVTATLAAVFTVCAQSVNAEGVFKDPLETPASIIGGAQTLAGQPMIAAEIVGQRIIAVGLRGLIVLSDDNGVTWRQAAVAVQSDLTAVVFPSAEVGFAVGHDGVILASKDGGETWEKKIDGNAAETVLGDHYKAKIAAGDQSLEVYLEQVKFNTQGGAVLPYLGVHFEDEKVGYVVGAFGSIVKTDDGGDTWMPWLEHIENPDFLHLNEIKKLGSDLYIVGEQGSVWKWSVTDNMFRRQATGYGGSLFGIIGNANYLLTFGLGGNAFRSDDAGETWHPVQTGAKAALTAGDVLEGGLPILVAENGGVFVGDEFWRSFQRRMLPGGTFSAGIKSFNGDAKRVVLAGYNGIGLRLLESPERRP